MRTIARLSAAFQLVDGYSKEGVKGASFLVDGAPVPFVAKPDGTYVFSNLPILPHTYQMTVPGYLPVQRTLPARPEFLPEVVILQHSPEGPLLQRIACFHLRFLVEEEPVQQETVEVMLGNPAGGLRLLEKAPRGAWQVKVAAKGKGLLFQHYRGKKTGEEVLFTGYDEGEELFQLWKPLEQELDKGELLCPLWRLRTDGDGKAILPAIGAFLPKEDGELHFALGSKKATLQTAAPSPSLSCTIPLKEEE